MAGENHAIGGILERLDRIEERADRTEERLGDHNADIAVVKTQLAGILRLLWMILAAVIGATVTILAKT